MSSGTIDGAGERQTCKLCLMILTFLTLENSRVRLRCCTQDGTLYRYLNKLFSPKIGMFVRKDLQ